MGKYMVCIAVGAVLTTVLAACGGGSGKSTGKEVELICDRGFEKGFAVSPLSPEIVNAGGGFDKTNVDTIRFGDGNEPPVWQMAQWASRHDLAGTPPHREEGAVSFYNAGKRITRYNDGTLLLEIKTSVEYDSPRADGQDWPHLLIEQKFPQRIYLSEMSALRFSMDYKLVSCDNHMTGDEFDDGLHTAQSPFYLVLKNVNETSGDFGASVWYGIPSFDWRYTDMTEVPRISWDIGTSMYIYDMPQKPVWGDIQFQDMQWHKADADILPFLLQSMDDMHEKGIFLNTGPGDICVTGMNFGWEVPGTFDAALLVKGISLKAELL